MQMMTTKACSGVHTLFVGLEGVRLAGDQDEQRVGHVHDGCLLEEGPRARCKGAHTPEACTAAYPTVNFEASCLSCCRYSY